jgi:hypothetical protein
MLEYISFVPWLHNFLVTVRWCLSVAGRGLWFAHQRHDADVRRCEGGVWGYLGPMAGLGDEERIRLWRGLILNLRPCCRVSFLSVSSSHASPSAPPSRPQGRAGCMKSNTTAIARWRSAAVSAADCSHARQRLDRTLSVGDRGLVRPQGEILLIDGEIRCLR